MRKVRDYDAELKALDDKAKALRARRLEQLGQLVIATGADALPIEQLAGALLIAADNEDAAATEARRLRGAAFFRDKGRARGGAGSDQRRATPGGGDAPSAAPEPSAP